MQTKESITRLVRWLCRKLCFDELLVAFTILLQVLNDELDDIKPRSDFQQKHPSYRKFIVDPFPPLTEAPPLPEVIPELDFKELIIEHRRKTGKDLKPVNRHKNSQLPPSFARCEHCNAPAKYLYVNDGKKNTQLRCKVCNSLFSSQRTRKESNAEYWCPYCSRALYQWKNDGTCIIFKCGNKACPCYLRNFEKLNEKEKQLQKTGMRSQFKLSYQYREYHFTPAELKTIQPEDREHSFNNIHNTFNTVGLVLAYSISFGLSSRMTRNVLQYVHGICISRQTVLNYIESAAVLVYNFLKKNMGTMNDKQLAGDETYIRINEQWNYTWFVIGAQSRAIRAFNISDNRGVLPALATINDAMKYAPENLDMPIDFIADGNPSYDAAIHAFNADKNGKPIKRRKVIGLANEDAESQQFRPFKQIIERLNRTYKFHTRARCGFKNTNGAAVITTLFVAYYNFLRPHSSLEYKPPIQLDLFDGINTIQGKWLKILQNAA